MVGLPRQTEVARVGLHDDDGVTESFAELARPTGVGFHRDHAGSGFEKRTGEGARSRADVDDDCVRS